MLIVAIDCTVVYAKRRQIFGRPVVTGLGAAAVSEYAFIEIRTDAGITGVGEIANVFDKLGTQLAEEVEQTLVPLVLGQDPFRIAHLNSMMRSALPDSEPALAAVDMALHDIVGKALETPVYNLLGGLSRDRIALSYSIPYGTPDETAQFAAQCVAEGFQTVKLKIGQSHDRDVECVRRVREAIGPNVVLRIDANMALIDVPSTLALIAAIAPFEPELVEQPLPPANLEALTAIRAATDVPIMLDESIRSPSSMLNVIRADAADVANIYVMESGGLMDASTNFKLAANAGLKCMIGSMPELGVGTAAQIHLGTAMPNLDLASDCCGTLYHEHHFLQTSLEIAGGYAYPSHAPGLGVELDHEMVRRHREPTNGR
jgi:L-alanine-DL-glutamate epimerase-like enolase superfamily enzyme